MKRTIFAIYLIAAYSISLMAQNFEILKDTNCLRVGDSIHYVFVTATIPQSSSFSEQIWDFSNSKYLGIEKEVCFVDNDSNHIKMVDKNAILEFSLDKERLFLQCLQTPLLNINFGNSFEYLKFPFSINDSLVCQIEGKGTYCSKNKMELLGTCCTKAMARGKLIMPSNNSLDNALLIRRSIVANINVSKDSLMSEMQEKPMKFKAAIFEWYAIGYRYPVLKVIKASIQKENHKVLEKSFAYAANVESMNNFTDKQHKEIRDRIQEVSSDSNAKQGNISYKVTSNGKQVSVFYSLASDSQLRFLICNTSGMAFKSISLQQQAGNNYRQDFNCSGLPLGEYVLYINVNDNTFAEKVSIK